MLGCRADQGNAGPRPHTLPGGGLNAGPCPPYRSRIAIVVLSLCVWVVVSVVERIRWNDALISLRFEAELAPFNAGQFIRAGMDIAGERIARPYSMVNAPDERPHEIYFNVVRVGPLSPLLAELQPGEHFW